MKRFIFALPAIALLALSAGAADGGSVTGKLVAKGSTWISVKGDGDAEGTMYMPSWRGGMPADGGGLDKEMLARFHELAVGSVVKLEWKMEERPRVVSVETVSAPERPEKPHGEVADRPGDGEERPFKPGKPQGEDFRPGEKPHRPDGEMERPVKPHRPDEIERPVKPHRPEEMERPGKPHRPDGEEERPLKPGKPHDMERPHKPMRPESDERASIVGVIVAKGENWIEVKTSREAEPIKFMPRWIGGFPKEGGGLDRDMIRTINKVAINQWYKIDYVTDEAKRVISITPTVQPK